MKNLQGYRTVIAFGIVAIGAVYQMAFGEVASITAPQSELLTAVLAIAFRYVTRSPVGQKPSP